MRRMRFLTAHHPKRYFCQEPKRPDASKLLKESTNFELKSHDWATGAYHIDADQQKKVEQEIKSGGVSKKDPETTTVILFPGQGTQHPGMADNLIGVPGVRDMFEYASSVMKFDLLKLCTKGPQLLLDMTINCQAATLVTSLAALEKLRDENQAVIDNCVATAGFSVGEYAALVFGGVLTFEDAVQLVKIRGEAMQACSEVRPSGLMTVHLNRGAPLNYGLKLAREWCQEKEGIQDPVCEIANFLYPDCRVVGGDAKALGFLSRNGKDFGIRRSKQLAVSGAFHTSLMKPAKNVLKKAFKEVHFSPPGIQIISNVLGKPYANEVAVRNALLEQVYKPVFWEQTMHELFHREKETKFPRTFEVGPGNTLRPILRAINVKAYSRSFKFDYIQQTSIEGKDAEKQ